MPNNVSDGALSDQVLDRLRLSAAMALAIPQLAVQVRLDDTISLEVRRGAAPDVSHRVLAPCMFHRAVAKALEMRRAGERIAMCGVPAGAEPAIDWGVAPGARLLSGGIVRVDDGAVWHHAGAVLGDEQHVAEALASAPDLVARRDETLEVTIVHGSSSRGDKSASRHAVDAVLGLVARVGVADLEQRLCGRAPAAPEPRFRH